MTIQDLRILYKRQTGRLPNGSYLSMNGHPINTNLDKDLSAYIEWLENVAITQLKSIHKLIP